MDVKIKVTQKQLAHDHSLCYMYRDAPYLKRQRGEIIHIILTNISNTLNTLIN